MTAPDRAPSRIWCLSRNNLDIYVHTEPGDHITIVAPDMTGALSALCVTRREARQLAKRINQCLDDTVKR